MIDDKKLCLVSIEDLRQMFYECLAQIEEAKSKQQDEDENKLISTKEVLERLHISRPTLWRWEKAKYLCPDKKIGNKNNYYRLADIKRIQQSL